ncbi:MAG: pyridoxal-phosphate dependent enzyme [Betaproteobacteria bacterium]|nr:pyridoxal-phosphate dependent enzyme [Betaproteobacteria bacterium]
MTSISAALLNGAASWVKAHAPSIRVIGVCAEGADSMAASWKEGRLVERSTVNTIADGSHG